MDIYPSQLNGTGQKGYVPQNQSSFSKSGTTPGVVGHRRWFSEIFLPIRRIPFDVGINLHGPKGEDLDYLALKLPYYNFSQFFPQCSMEYSLCSGLSIPPFKICFWDSVLVHLCWQLRDMPLGKSMKVLPGRTNREGNTLSPE